jgi:hypothetical protein
MRLAAISREALVKKPTAQRERLSAALQDADRERARRGGAATGASDGSAPRKASPRSGKRRGRTAGH